MRVLHLYSDYRWTGPAEPTVFLVQALQRKGLDVRFACSDRSAKDHKRIAFWAADFGVEAITDFKLSRYGRPDHLARDLIGLGQYLRNERIDVLHTHLSHDHVLGGLAAWMGKRPIRVVRTNHKARALRAGVGSRWLFRIACDAYLGFSDRAARRDQRDLKLSEENIHVINTTIDLQRFSMRNGTARQSVRASLGLEPADFVVGMVARMQRHRRFDLALEALSLALTEAPELRLLILGKGTYRHTVVGEPARRLGIADRVVMPLGREVHDYPETLRAMDTLLYLVPGSDGTCRAVREAMASGLPVMVSPRGFLSELVSHDHTGLIFDETPESLAGAMVRLVRDAELRLRLGQAAYEHAQSHFRIDDQAQAVAAVYEKLLA